MADSQVCKKEKTSLVQLKFRYLKYLLSGQKSDKGCITEEGKFLVCKSPRRLCFCFRMEGEFIRRFAGRFGTARCGNAKGREFD